MRNGNKNADSLESTELKPRKTPLALRVREVFNRSCGIPIEADLAPYHNALSAIHAFRKDAGLDAFPDEGLARMFHDLRTRVGHAEPARKKRRRDRRMKSGISNCENAAYSRLVVEAFGLVFEAARRALGLITHDAQLIAGLAMCGPRVAELPTGEGKTLAAVFPACLPALSGRGVHILTFNDYLARRDAAWMGPVYRLLGLSVGFIQEGMDNPAKRRAYACDVTYATAKEAGFDFLRDQLVYDAADRVHRPFHMAIVDEADSILIDEARIPLVISGLAGTLDQDAGGLAGLMRFLVPARDFITDEAKSSVSLTDAGLENIERLLGCGNLYAAENERLLAAIHCALHAEALLCRDKDYIVRDGRVEIVDEFTGRVMDKRHWPDGLQAAVEAKEHVLRRSEGRILGIHHASTLFQGVSQTLRHDGDGPSLGGRIQGVLRFERYRCSARPAVRPGGFSRRRLHP